MFNQNNIKIKELNDDLEKIQNKIKIEQRNKQYRKDTYNLEKNKIEGIISQTEKELKSAINNLNEKENFVYDIQKDKFKNFSSEIKSFESVYNELDLRSIKTLAILDKKKAEEKKQFRYISMEEADYESYNCELKLQELEKEKLLNRIGAIERTYPKEFEYLYQDLVLKKELQEVINQRNVIKRKLGFMYSDKNKLSEKIKLYKEDVLNKKNKMESINLSIEEASIDSYFNSMEKYLSDNVSDIMNFDKLRLLTKSK